MGILVGEGDEWVAWQSLAVELGRVRPSALGGQCAEGPDRRLLQPGRCAGHAIGEPACRRTKCVCVGRHELRQGRLWVPMWLAIHWPSYR